MQKIISFNTNHKVSISNVKSEIPEIKYIELATS
jgi:hypothetical protein